MVNFTRSPSRLTRSFNSHPIAVFGEFALAAEGRDWLAEVLPVGDK